MTKIFSTNGYIEIPNDQVSFSLSFWTIAWCCFVGDSSRGLLMPTLWPFISNLGGNLIWQGIAVATFSVGRVISSPILGMLADIYGYKWVLIISNVLTILGAILYSQSTNLNLIVVSQLIIGFGAGTLGVTRSYVAENSCKKDRTNKMAWLNAMQYAGFTVTPIFGALISYLALNYNPNQNNYINLNEYNASSIVLSAFGMISIILLFNAFNEQNRDVTTATEKDVEMPSHKNIVYPPPQEIRVRYIKLALFGCFINFITRGVIAIYETLGLVIALNFNWSNMQLALLVSSSGLIGVFVLLNFNIFTSFLSDYDLMLIGMIKMSLACLILSFISDNFFFQMIQLCISFFVMYSIAYPVGNTAALAMFSKIISSGPQGKMLGWFASAGSLARVIFPIMSGFLSNYYGESSMFLIGFSLLVISIAGTAWFKADIIEMLNTE